jgi:MarR family transcriptional regulator, organic hydroperoxide resistance regulator
MQKFNRYESVGFLLQRAAKSLSAHAASVLHAKGFGLKIEHFIILTRLWEENNLTQHQLGERTCQDKTNTTRAIDLLEEKGFVKRVQGENDRRNKYIQLTSKGKHLEQKFVPIIMEDVLGIACKGITKEEIDLLKKLLTQIHENIQHTEQ